MSTIPTYMKCWIIAALSLSLVLGAVLPKSNHVPTIIETLQDHVEMVGEHGHSHGYEEDLLWAIHGHSHDIADHDHNPIMLPSYASLTWQEFVGDTWRFEAVQAQGSSHNRLERPPRV